VPLDPSGRLKAAFQNTSTEALPRPKDKKRKDLRVPLQGKWEDGGGIAPAAALSTFRLGASLKHLRDAHGFTVLPQSSVIVALPGM